MTEASPPEYNSLIHPNITLSGDLQPPEYSPPPKYASVFEYPVISKKFQTEKLKKSAKPLYDFTQGRNLKESVTPLWSEIFSSTNYIHRVLPLGPTDSPLYIRRINDVFKSYDVFKC